MRFEIHHFHHPDQATAERLERIERMLGQLIRNNEMLDPAVQSLLDAAKAATAIGPALDAGFKSLSAQVGTLTAQVAALQAGQVLTDDDKATLTQSANDLNTMVTTLKTDIPAGTSAAAPSA